MGEFRMPALGADMDHGTVVEWLVAPGDTVHRGDVVAVVDTEKSAVDVECFEDGVVDRLIVEVGEQVPVGAPLAVIGGADAAPVAAPPAGPPPIAGRPGTAPLGTAPGPPVPTPPGPGPPTPTPPVPPVPGPPVPTPPVPEPPLPGPPAPTPPVPDPGAPARGAPTPAPPAHPPPRPAAARPAPGVAAPAPDLGAPVEPWRVATPPVRRRAATAGVDLAVLHGTGPHGTVTRDDVERAARGPHRVRATPYARRLARERGLDLAGLPARHDGERVLRARDLPSPAPEPARGTSHRPRSATAALMARAKREIPHFYLHTEIELGAALDRLRAHNREVPVAARVLPAALLAAAVARAARVVPELNGSWHDGAFTPGTGVHLGVAVALRGGGLAVPVLRDADRLGVDALMSAMRSATERARAGRPRSSEASGATITITNLGDLGVDAVTGVIYPPQVALVGFGAIRPRPWADRGTVVVRPVVTASLSADHRASDGATGARLLHEVDRLLHTPEDLS